MPTTHAWRSRRGSVRWRVTPEGVEVAGVDAFPQRDPHPPLTDGIQRTPGRPATTLRLWHRFRFEIATCARWYSTPKELEMEVPPLVPLLIACLATESRGDVDARRREPGWVSNELTPHRVSSGAWQTLISTARAALSDEGVPATEITEESLRIPVVSCRAAADYIGDETRAVHGMDPVLVAATYNAGGVYSDVSAGNPWGMRCYPLGTGRHVTRFVRWYGDALEAIRIAGLPANGARLTGATCS